LKPFGGPQSEECQTVSARGSSCASAATENSGSNRATLSSNAARVFFPYIAIANYN
jgi:hypothetical protein